VAIDITSTYSELEEDCLTPVDIVLIDPERTSECRYYILFIFHTTVDGGGDITGKKFPVAPNIPHSFWLNPVGVGAISVWGLKECPDTSDHAGVLETISLEASVAHYEQLREVLNDTADDDFKIVDMHMVVMKVTDCDNFDAKVAALGIGVGAGVGAGGVAATLLTAFGTSSAAATATGAGAATATGATAGGVFGAAGAITGTGILIAVGIAIVVAVIIGLIIWLIVKKRCCELGVDESVKGAQGSVLLVPLGGNSSGN